MTSPLVLAAASNMPEQAFVQDMELENLPCTELMRGVHTEPTEDFHHAPSWLLQLSKPMGELETIWLP